MPIFSGDDGLTWPMIALGAVGVVSVASNVVPYQVVEMVNLGLDGDVRAARGAHDALAPLFRALFLEPNPCPVKAALQMRGLIPTAEVRLPMVPATDAVRAAVEPLLIAD